MKRILLCTLAVVATLALDAQQLVRKRVYTPKQFADTRIELTGRNKPNGSYSRLREHVAVTDLPRPEVDEDLQLFIAEPAQGGYLGLWRTPLAANHYCFIAALYDEDKQLRDYFNLSRMLDDFDCELQDIRSAADGRLYFNMACPSYSENLKGKCSRLYCLDPEIAGIRWQTPYLTSNNIFILHDRYIICGYGFTAEKDWLCLLDRETGRVLSKVPLPTAHTDLEIVGDRLYVTVYDDNIHEYEIK